MPTRLNRSLLLSLLFAALGWLTSDRAAGQTFTILHYFGSVSHDGANPAAGLTLSGSTLYGTTGSGGSNGNGTVFTIDTSGSNFAVLKSFNIPPDGVGPEGDLALSGSTLYGTAEQGGTGPEGTVFKIDITGSNYTVLKNFTNSVDGRAPTGGLTLSGSALYGTTAAGGTNDNGTVFKIDTNGSNYAVLKRFFFSTDGAVPNAGLALSGSTLYGTTTSGGAANIFSPGTVFKIDTSGSNFAVLKAFTDSPDGADPQGDLTLSGGTLYGTTYEGGSTNGYGTVFKIDTGGGNYTVLKTFTNSPDGRLPQGGLTLFNSTLYGTTFSGGSGGKGTVFKINTDGSGYAVIKNFTSSPSDGANPKGNLTLSGGTLYGTTFVGGIHGVGVVFSIALWPKLAIALAGSNVILTWSTNWSGYTLQSATNAVSPATWSANLPPPVIVSGQYTVTNAISGQRQFYRLSQ